MRPFDAALAALARFVAAAHLAEVDVEVTERAVRRATLEAGLATEAVEHVDGHTVRGTDQDGVLCTTAMARATVKERG